MLDAGHQVMVGGIRRVAVARSLTVTVIKGQHRLQRCELIPELVVEHPCQAVLIVDIRIGQAGYGKPSVCGNPLRPAETQCIVGLPERVGTHLAAGRKSIRVIRLQLVSDEIAADKTKALIEAVGEIYADAGLRIEVISPAGRRLVEVIDGTQPRIDIPSGLGSDIDA